MVRNRSASLNRNDSEREVRNSVASSQIFLYFLGYKGYKGYKKQAINNNELPSDPLYPSAPIINNTSPPNFLPERCSSGADMKFIFDFRGADLFYRIRIPLGIVLRRTARGVLLIAIGQRCPIQIENYAPKLSNRIFSAGTPRLSNKLTTDCAIIGGPHMR